MNALSLWMVESEKHGNTAVGNQSQRAPKRWGRLS
jgi:hypothetical protein